MIIDLSGMWQFALDTSDVGIHEKWFAKDLEDSVQLPGTTDIAKKGFRNRDTTSMHLNREFRYEGPAWYRKKIIIPDDYQNKFVRLIMERTKFSQVWIDDQWIGESHILQTPQSYDLSSYVLPGEHTITVRINNDLKLTPYGNVHIYSDDTQTNWNGIIGKIMLEATAKTHISDMQIYADADSQKCKVKIGISNYRNVKTLNIKLTVKQIIDGKETNLKPASYRIPSDSVVFLEYVSGRELKLWDEYEQPLYEITAVLNYEGNTDSKTASFGVRKFVAEGTRFKVNGRPVFLRGKHDACVFPLTGHPPMDVQGWLNVFRIAKSYGINHYRFHSYCPPEAAFMAADREGIYLQAETPFWGGLEADSTAEMLKAEGIAMLKNYANHPSFVLFSHGNEIWSGHDRVEKNILAFKQYDNRQLYTMGSNNNIGYAGPRKCDDFFVAARTPFAHDTILTHTRLTHAFADSRDGGILNTQVPSTKVNFDYAVSQINMPLISHEIGQYQIYPDYSEIEKYTGVLKPWNLEVFRKRLSKSGMLEQNKDFQKSSGAWSALCYKAEMEAAMRTSGLAGFQLLDLQDFPGQGTALVGILDAFMDDKGVIAREEWLKSCNDVVILLNFPKYCWQNSENFEGSVQIVNYSNQNITDDLKWEVMNRNGDMIQSGTIAHLNISNDGLNNYGEIGFSLGKIMEADQLFVNVSLIHHHEYSNTYPIWIYPQINAEPIANDVLVAEKLDIHVLEMIRTGKKVLLFPAAGSIQKNSIQGLFPPEFWNYGMFKGISERVKKPVSPGTLGILTDPLHPLFSSFPTEFHTNWQWFSIIKASNPLILNVTESDYRPIVQVIDNLERNHKLGLIFEFKLGKGKLLVCTAPLRDIMQEQAALQLYRSILDYMQSGAFNPRYSVDENFLKQLFQ